MNPSYPFDPDLHGSDPVAAGGACSYHRRGGADSSGCTGEPVVSFEGEDGEWHSGCSAALEELVERGTITPLGQGA